jgi:hypothetical protein
MTEMTEFEKEIIALKMRINWLQGERDFYREERDAARRMWCEAAPVGNCLSVDDMNRRARAEAERRGWDCYKENA